MYPITWIRQPTKRTCGQTCVAMLVGKPVEEIIRAVGHATGTTAYALAKALKAYGWTAGVMTLTSAAPVPDTCIVKVSWHKRDSRSPTGYGRGFRLHWHWVLRVNGRYYDPMCQTVQDWSAFGGAVTAFMPLTR